MNWRLRRCAKATCLYHGQKLAPLLISSAPHASIVVQRINALNLGPLGRVTQKRLHLIEFGGLPAIERFKVPLHERLGERARATQPLDDGR